MKEKNYIDFITNLTTVHTIINKRLDNSLGAIHGISFTEYLILSNINNSHNETIRRIDLATSIGLTASGITRSLNPLEKIGLITKEANTRDARVSLVRLTVSGKKIFDESTVTLNTAVKKLFKDLKDELFDNALEVLFHLQIKS